MHNSVTCVLSVRHPNGVVFCSVMGPSGLVVLSNRLFFMLSKVRILLDVEVVVVGVVVVVVCVAV